MLWFRRPSDRVMPSEAFPVARHRLVARALLVMQSSDVSAIIDVSHQEEPALGFRVPMEMRERYRTPHERVLGVATYARFRQFQVKTGETIGKPPG